MKIAVATQSVERDFPQLVTLVAAGAMLAALVAYGWLGTCARLEGDDYAWAQGSPRAAMSTTWETYNGWSGCYSCIFLLALLLPISLKVVMVLPAAALGLWLLALLALFLELFREWPANRRWGASLLAATATLWATLDSAITGQALYWPDGMIRYFVPLVLLTFAAALILAQSRAERGPGLLGCTLTGLLMFVCGGFSETTLAVQITAVAMALLLWRTDRALRRILVVCFIATLASALVVCLAPGNGVRQGAIGPPTPVAAAVGEAIWNAALWTGRFFILKTATAVSVFAAGWLAARAGLRSRGSDSPLMRSVMSSARNQGVGFLAATALLTMSFLPVAYVIHVYPPSRALIVPQFVMVLALFACGSSCAAVIGVPQFGARAVRSFELLVCSVLIAAPLWSVYETIPLHTDAARYAMLWDRREHRLRAASRAGQLDVVLDPLPEDLALVRGIAIPSENGDIARYYGFRSAKEDASHQPSAEPWTREAWTKLRPEYLPDDIRGFLRRIRRKIRGS